MKSELFKISNEALLKSFEAVFNRDDICCEYVEYSQSYIYQIPTSLNNVGINIVLCEDGGYIELINDITGHVYIHNDCLLISDINTFIKRVELIDTFNQFKFFQEFELII